MINAKLLSQLCCPESRQALRLATESEVDSLNKKIGSGAVKNKVGKVLEKRIDGALIREDGGQAYLIIDKLPILLADEAVAL